MRSSPRPLVTLGALVLLAACQRQVPLTCPPAETRVVYRDVPTHRDEATHAKLDLLIVKVETLEQQLLDQRAAKPAVRGRHDPAVVYSVDVTGDPFVGPASAKVTIVKATEYACPFCQRVEPTLAELAKIYGKDVRIVYKSYIVHPDRATIPAWAACAAHAQGKFAQLNDLLWQKGFPSRLAQADMLAFAAELGLDVRRFEADLASDRCKQDVANDQKILEAVGVTGTPAFFINGRFLSGARPLEQYRSVIDEELKKADEALARREATVSNYYQKMVVEKGKPSL